MNKQEMKEAREELISVRNTLTRLCNEFSNDFRRCYEENTVIKQIRNSYLELDDAILGIIALEKEEEDEK